MQKVTKDEYLLDPCRKCATAYHKNSKITLTNLRVVNEKDYHKKDGDGEITKYFKLIHNLKGSTDYRLNSSYQIKTIDIKNDIKTVSEIITSCYDNVDMPPLKVKELTAQEVFDNDCWIFIIDTTINIPIALGIADFDKELKEGSLEWIQVLKQYRGKGLGQVLVYELLSRLKQKADFVTVGGEIDNFSNPLGLYKKCGFTGDDVWLVIKTDK